MRSRFPFRASIGVLLVFSMLAAGLGAASCIYYRHHKRNLEREAEGELAAIADLKIRQIVAWRQERLSNLEVLRSDLLLGRTAARVLRGDNRVAAQRELHEALALRRAAYGYRDILFFDPEGNLLVSASGAAGSDPATRRLVRETVRSGRVVLPDLRRLEGGTVCLDMLAPLVVREGLGAERAGAVLLRLDPARFIEPLMEMWPAHSPTAETVLARRDNDYATFLTSLRHRPNQALEGRVPLRYKERPVVQAVLGRTGSYRGRDYRNVPVLAALRAVPDSPWVMLAKMDQEEVHRPVRTLAWQVAGAVAGLLLTTGLAIAVLWRRRELHFYRQAYETELRRRALEKHYVYLSRYANDMILLADRGGRIVEVNERTIEAYGYSREELIGMNATQLRRSETRSEVDRRFAEIGRHEGLVYEAEHVRKDGSTFPVEISARVLTIEGEQFYQGVFRDISERKHAEAALQQSELCYRALVEQTPAVTYRVRLGSSGPPIYVSPQIEGLAGFRPEEFERDPDLWFRLVHPDDLSRLQDALQACASGRPATGLRYRVRHRDGSIRWVRDEATLIRGDRGEPAYLQGVVLDVTDQKRAEDELQLLSRAVENSPAAVVITDAAGDIEYVNRKFTDVTGYSAQEVLGRNPRLLKSGLTDPAVYARLWMSLKAGREWRGTFCNRKKNGELYWEDAIVCPIQDAEGGQVRYLAVKQDVTSQREMVEALRLSEERFRVAAENASDLLYEWDLATDRISYFSQRARRSGEGHWEFPPTFEAWVDRLHTDDRPRVRDAVWRHVESGEPFREQCRMLDSELGLLHLDLRGTVQRDSAGRARRWIGVVSDITEARRAQESIERHTLEIQRKNEELAAALAAAREATELKSRFLANMSHEIRTPMHGVLGMSELLAGTRLDAEQQDYVETIHGSAENLLHLLNDILDLSKIEAGRLELESVTFDPARVLRDVEADFAVRTREKRLRFSVEAAPALPRAAGGDPLRLRQVLTNLVGNALKFTDQGEIAVHAGLAAESAGAFTLRCSVRDSGVGIEPGRRPWLFQSFVQGDGSTTRRYGGTGLGLAISRQLVELMGGEIGVESEPGRGSTFWFTAVLEKRASAAEEPDREAVAPWSASGHRRILVVEDNAVNQKILMRLLQKAGWPADVAGNGREAVEAAQPGRYALILMDVQMPEMDGFAATAEIRRRQGTGPRLPIVAMTANAMKGDRERCLAAGMDDYISKPVPLEDLLHLLARWIAPQPASV